MRDARFPGTWRPVAALLLILLVAGGCSKAKPLAGSVYDPALPAAEIAGANWDGRPFRLSEQQDKVALLFFGYTACPDVCPTTLAEMRELLVLLGDQAGQVAPVFITVDPERDTPERLAEYVPAFDPRIYGVYLEPEPLEAAKAAYGVIAEKRPYPGKDLSAGYTVDHTARVFVVDREGRLRVSFPYGTTPQEMLADVQQLLGERS